MVAGSSVTIKETGFLGAKLAHPAVYDELHRIAERYFRGERAGNTLQPTALVNEVYIRLVKQSGLSWQNRAHFFGIAANTMRRILVERARARNASKRGSGDYKLDLTDVNDVPVDKATATLEYESMAAFGGSVLKSSTWPIARES